MAQKDIYIENGETVLSGKLSVPQDPDGSAALFVHGYGAIGRTCAQYARRLAQSGTTSLLFDLGGHGNSSGNREELTVNNHLDDVRQAYDYLARQHDSAVNLERIGVAGMSYGGYLATLLTVRRPVRSLLLRSPLLYPDNLRDKPRDSYTDEIALYTEPDPDNSALRALHSFTGRVLLVVSEHDSVVLPAITDAYKSAAPNIEQRVLEGAQHSLDAITSRAFNPMVVEWADNLQV